MNSLREVVLARNEGDLAAVGTERRIETIAAEIGETDWVRSVQVHHEDLLIIQAINGSKRDPLPVRAECRIIELPRRPSHEGEVRSVSIHDVHPATLVARVGDESNLSAIGAKREPSTVKAIYSSWGIDQQGDIRSIRVHHVDLRSTAAIRDECNPP